MLPAQRQVHRDCYVPESARIVGIFGPSGIGKTTLAQRLAGKDAVFMTLEDWRMQAGERIRTQRGDEDCVAGLLETVDLDNLSGLHDKRGTREELVHALVARVHKGRKTILVEGVQDRSLEDVLRAVENQIVSAPTARVRLDIPRLLDRWRWAKVEGARLGVPSETIREAMRVRPWSFTAALGALQTAAFRTTLRATGDARRSVEEE